MPAAPTPRLRPDAPAPPDYYRDNLLRVLDFVIQRNADLLDDGERAWCDALLAASRAAQRLFARIITRKGPWVRVDKLAYVEVPDRTAAIAELVERRLIVLDPPAPADRLLASLTRAELDALFAPRQGRRRPRKADLILGLIAGLPDERIRMRLHRTHHWLALRREDVLRTLWLLYFGDLHQDHTTFVLEDLGVVEHEAYPLCEHARRFEDRAALRRHLELRRLAALVGRCGEHEALGPWLIAHLWDAPADRHDRRVRDRALNALGHRFERRGDAHAALECYARSSTPPARERRVRILHRLGDRAGAVALLARLRAAPASVVEEDFGERFLVRGGGVTPPVTVRDLAGHGSERIEEHAMLELEAGGARCWHLENAFPRTLAALAFWEVVFAPVHGAFVNPYQDGPVDLYWPDFAATRGAAISARASALSAPGAFARAVRATWYSRHGVANALASWWWLDETALDQVLDVIPHAHLLALATRVIRDPANTRTGFPDLLVLHPQRRYEFVEVKGPTDALQPAQRMWFKYLLARGYPARVLKYRR